MSPAEVGQWIGRRPEAGADPAKDTLAQSYYDVRNGTKRLWVRDAEEWARKIGGRVALTFEDPWAQLDAAIGALPQSESQLKRSLRLLMADRRPQQSDVAKVTGPPVRQRRRAAAS